MKITLAQLNPIVGDIGYNTEKVLEVWKKFSGTTDLIVFPELFLTGYPPQDLLEKPKFISDVENVLTRLINASPTFPDTGIVIGAPVQVPVKQRKGLYGKGLYNSAILISGGTKVFAQYKSLLPSYDVFDETRYFEVPPMINVFEYKGERIALTICEDAWAAHELNENRGLYAIDPVALLKEKGATLFINISASPFYTGKDQIRFRLIRHHAEKHGVPFVYVNQVGGNDELIFDGRSMVFDGKGEPILIMSGFEEKVTTIDTSQTGDPDLFRPLDRIASMYDALVLGVRDYLRKCGFSKAIVGLSGGIDSAVTCCLAKAALGKKNVLSLYMPSPYSSDQSGEYAHKLAFNLGIELRVIPIDPIYESYRCSLHGLVDAESVDVTLENIQARIRGNILMAYANRGDHLLLSTGNKSELAVGYCTLYGDMSGGLAVIADVAKTDVYGLAEYINTLKPKEVIPREIIERPPSAELRPDQQDTDTLPPYETLDKILYEYVEAGSSAKEIKDMGVNESVVEWVLKAVDRNEYKRRQAPPGLKVTSKAFGTGRRMPIAGKYSF